MSYLCRGGPFFQLLHPTTEEIVRAGANLLSASMIPGPCEETYLRRDTKELTKSSSGPKDASADGLAKDGGEGEKRLGGWQEYERRSLRWRPYALALRISFTGAYRTEQSRGANSSGSSDGLRAGEC